tara:strand:+ start:1600 stop:2127 length:528 start_codon:yes stop_codon:yes gene_type:complete
MDKINFEDMDNEVDFDTPTEDFVIEDAPLQEAKKEEVVVDTKVNDRGITKELESTYNKVYDAILFEGKYEKEYKLGKKYGVVVSTRSADEDNIISRKLDAMNFKTVSAFNNMAAVFTLSYSLAEFNGKDLRSMTVTQRYDYVNRLPSPVIELLSTKMLDFDRLIREAMNYGSENF